MKAKRNRLNEMYKRLQLDSVLQEQFQASGLNRRALSLFKNKDKSDLKNILRSMVFEMADDGFDENEVLNLFEKLIYAEVKMLYKKAVK